MDTLSDQIIKRTLAAGQSPIPEEIFHEAKRCILDYCGVVLAGAQANREKNKQYLTNIPPEGAVTLFGLDAKADIYTAALINGMDAHAVELDDGHRFGMMHMGAPIISAVFAAAEGKQIPGEKLLRAIICGYDVAIALARNMQPGHKLRGYHATGTCCTVGAAMSIAVLLDYHAGQIQGALSAAATSAAGLLEVIDDASQLKPYNIGRAAMDSIAAAFAGGAGFKGPDDVIGGKRGFYAVLASADDFQRVKSIGLFANDRYAIAEIYTKPYAACRHCHPAIEAALHLRSQIGQIDPSHIESITVRTYKLAIEGHDHTDICNISSAKMSTPYSVSAAMLYGLYGMGAYEPDILCRQEIKELMKKIQVVLSEELDALNPQKRGAIVEVALNDGRTICDRVDYPRGEPESRMADSELEVKAKELAMIGGKSEEEVEQMINCVWNFTNCFPELYTLLK